MEEQGLILERATFEFTQDSNCVSDKEYEFLTVEVESSLGIDRGDAGDHFYVLKTEQWSIDNEEDLKQIFDRIKKVIETK
jgi:hypothetical protein